MKIESISDFEVRICEYCKKEFMFSIKKKALGQPGRFCSNKCRIRGCNYGFRPMRKSQGITNIIR